MDCPTYRTWCFDRLLVGARWLRNLETPYDFCWALQSGAMSFTSHLTIRKPKAIASKTKAYSCRADLVRGYTQTIEFESYLFDECSYEWEFYTLLNLERYRLFLLTDDDYLFEIPENYRIFTEYIVEETSDDNSYWRGEISWQSRHDLRPYNMPGLQQTIYSWMYQPMRIVSGTYNMGACERGVYFDLTTQPGVLNLYPHNLPVELYVFNHQGGTMPLTINAPFGTTINGATSVTFSGFSSVHMLFNPETQEWFAYPICCNTSSSEPHLRIINLNALLLTPITNGMSKDLAINGIFGDDRLGTLSVDLGSLASTLPNIGYTGPNFDFEVIGTGQRRIWLIEVSIQQSAVTNTQAIQGNKEIFIGWVLPSIVEANGISNSFSTRGFPTHSLNGRIVYRFINRTNSKVTFVHLADPINFPTLSLGNTNPPPTGVFTNNGTTTYLDSNSAIDMSFSGGIANYDYPTDLSERGNIFIGKHVNPILDKNDYIELEFNETLHVFQEVSTMNYQNI